MTTTQFTWKNRTITIEPLFAHSQECALSIDGELVTLADGWTFPSTLSAMTFLRKEVK